MEQDVRNLVQELEVRWKSLTIANDFVFGKVMLDEDLCKEVLEAILSTDIEKIEYVGRQDAIDVTEDGHGVRLDVYVRDARGTVCSVEMQAIKDQLMSTRVASSVSQRAASLALRKVASWDSTRDTSWAWTRVARSDSKKARQSARSGSRSLSHVLTRMSDKTISFARLQTLRLGQTCIASTPSARNNAKHP